MPSKSLSFFIFRDLYRYRNNGGKNWLDLSILTRNRCVQLHRTTALALARLIHGPHLDSVASSTCQPVEHMLNLKGTALGQHRLCPAVHRQLGN